MGGADHLGEPVITVAPVSAADLQDLALLRHALWPKGSVAEHLADATAMLAQPDTWIGLIARLADGTSAGFAEASIRHDYVNGCKTSPVGFLEGIYVIPAHRRSGVARLLVAAAEDWVRQHGCSEMASDAAIDNVDSHRMHGALGFDETQRVVYFRKALG